MDDDNTGMVSFPVAGLIDHYRKPHSTAEPRPRPPQWLIDAVERGTVVIEDDRIIAPSGVFLRGEWVSP